jgi:DDE superfamily endonuclease
MLRIAVSPNGWTDQDLGIAWMKKVFEPQTRALCNATAPRLLILDGHNSHTTADFLDYAYEHNIIVICLPPHTTHHLQPCDVAVFSPLASEWKKAVDQSFAEGEPVDRYNLLKTYAKARKIAFKSSTIQEAFRLTGIWPLDINAIPVEAYGPSMATSTQLSVPGVPDLLSRLSAARNPSNPPESLSSPSPPLSPSTTTGLTRIPDAERSSTALSHDTIDNAVHLASECQNNRHENATDSEYHNILNERTDKPIN